MGGKKRPETEIFTEQPSMAKTLREKLIERLDEWLKTEDARQAVEHEDPYTLEIIFWCAMAPDRFLIFGDDIVRWPGFSSPHEVRDWASLFLNKDDLLKRLENLARTLQAQRLQEIKQVKDLSKKARETLQV